MGRAAEVSNGEAQSAPVLSIPCCPTLGNRSSRRQLRVVVAVVARHLQERAVGGEYCRNHTFSGGKFVVDVKLSPGRCAPNSTSPRLPKYRD